MSGRGDRRGGGRRGGGSGGDRQGQGNGNRGDGSYEGAGSGGGNSGQGNRNYGGNQGGGGGHHGNRDQGNAPRMGGQGGYQGGSGSHRQFDVNRNRGGFSRGGAYRGKSSTVYKDVIHPSEKPPVELDNSQKWKAFSDGIGCVNKLPSPIKAAGNTYAQENVKILVNYIPVKITLPKGLYQYELQIVKRKTGQGNSPPRNVSQDLRKKVILCALFNVSNNYGDSLTAQYGQDFGIVSDFSVNLLTVQPLPMPLELEVDGMLLEEDGWTFYVKALMTALSINPKIFGQNFVDAVKIMTDEEKRTVERFYSTAMRCISLHRFTPMKRSKIIDFMDGGRSLGLGGGLISYGGYDVTLPLANGWKPFINVELANLVTYLDGPVFTLLEDSFASLGWQSTKNVRDVTQWSKAQVQKANSILQRCKVEYKPGAIKLKETVNRVVTDQRGKAVPVRAVMFELNGKQISVYDYFRQQYPKLELRHPNGPCLESTRPSKPKFPAEICKIVSQQSYNRKLDDKQVREIGTVSKKPPLELQTTIGQAVTDLDLTRSQIMSTYGINVLDNGKLHSVTDAKILPAPELVYGRKLNDTDPTKRAVVIPAIGQWDFHGQGFKFYQNATVVDWGVYNLNPKIQDSRDKFAGGVSREFAEDFTRKLIAAASKMGIDLKEHKFYAENALDDNDESQNSNKDRIRTIFQRFKTNCKSDKGFILVIIPKKGSLLYNHVKQVAELEVGILTQCAVGSNIMNGQRVDSICANLLLKLNSKHNGVNHVIMPPPNYGGCINIFKNPVMIVGADVTHPPPTAQKVNKDGKEVGPPSYAAVTGSIHRTGMPYMMHIHAQEKAGKGAAEVVQGLDNIMEKFIRRYKKETGILPCRIIYFRDGVGEGQFQELLRTEMSAIRAACTRIRTDYEPLITFISVQKRHKTRFFLEGNNDNAIPGTVVDTDIVHKTEADFYLLSHATPAALKGTSRPTRYHVLWDDSDFNIGEIQSLAYFLCYMFVRCTKSVKIPAPTYYAHWAAKRAEVLARGLVEEHYGNVEKINEILLKREGGNGSVAAIFPMHFV